MLCTTDSNTFYYLMSIQPIVSLNLCLTFLSASTVPSEHWHDYPSPSLPSHPLPVRLFLFFYHDIMSCRGAIEFLLKLLLLLATSFNIIILNVLTIVWVLFDT